MFGTALRQTPAQDVPEDSLGRTAAVVAELRRKLAAPRQGGPGVHGAPITTGLATLDAALLGGLPRGRLTEAVGTGGKMSLSLRSLAGATQRGELAAFVDAADALDPAAAARLGVDLRRVLWVRTGDGGVRAALQAADHLLGAGGFGVIVLYLSGATERGALRTGTTASASSSGSAWHRLQQRCERAHAAVLVVADQPIAGSFATATLRCEADAPVWQAAPGGRLRLHARGARVDIERSRLGPPSDGALVTLCK